MLQIVNNIENLYSIDTVREEMQAAISYYRYTGDNRIIIHDRFEVIDEVRDCRELFDELEGVLSASWDIMYEKAGEYYKQNGDLMIPAAYHTEEGYALGRWLTTQRLAYAGKTDKPLTQVQIDRLEAIGIVWDSHLDFIWNRYFEKAKAYYEQHGDLNVPKDYTVDGLKLGIWILRMRMAQANRRDTVVTPEKKKKLDSIGMIWSLLSEQWERNYLEAMRYYNEHGSLYMDTKYMTDSGFKLGYWISHLRQKKAELTDEQIGRLDAIGMVWDTDRFKFDEGLRHAQAYLKELGGLNVPTKYVCSDGFALGKWLNLKRRQYANGRLSGESIRALEQLGIVWRPADEKWGKMFALAKEYNSSHGDLDVPVTEKQLYSWLGKQRIAKENGKLTAEQIKKLSSIGMIWDKTEYNWLQCFNALKSYFVLHSTTQLPYRYTDENGLQLSEWLTRQKRRYKQGKLPMSYTEQLRSIGVEL